MHMPTPTTAAVTRPSTSASALSAGSNNRPSQLNANSPNINQFVLQKLQTLIAANPAFLTGGIPTHLLSQFMQEMNVSTI